MLAALILALAGLPDDSAVLVAEFRKFYGKDKTPRERLEAVHVLEGIEGGAAAEALLVALEDEDFGVRQATVEVLASHEAAATAEMLLDEVLLNKRMKRKTLLRAGVAEALGGTGHDFLLEPLVELLDDKSEEVKLGVVAGLGRLGDAAAAPALSEVAVADDGGLAVAALDALVAIGDGPAAEAAVLAALTHADWRVRARGMGAVVDLRLKAGVRPLIERMQVEEGRLAGDAYAALKSVTMRDLSDDPEVWRSWWDRNEERYELPDPEAVAQARAELARSGTRYAGPKKQFLGLETKSENILFVIDVSGSMETPFGDVSRLAASGRTYDSVERLEIVKQELAHTIDSLPDTSSFNIIAFATGVDLWRKTLARANVLNKSNARTWVDKLEPLGGSQASFRVQAGLADLSNDEGQTNTHLALMTALGEPPEEAARGGFDLSPAKSPVDTIFFLTDGEPTIGESVDMLEIRSHVRRVNQYRGVQIHVIFVGEFGGEDLRLLAQENGGVFVSVGG